MVLNEIYAKYVERMAVILKEIHPAIKGGNGGFNEVNQTSNYIAAAEVIYGFGKVIPWYELAVPLQSKKDKRIDGMVVCKEEKQVLLIESKRYEGWSDKPFGKLEESKEDAGRLEKIADDVAFMSSCLRITPEKYAEYEVIGVILGAIWPDVGPHKPNAKDQIVDAFRKHEAFPSLKGEYYGAEGIIETNSQWLAQWEYRLPAFAWAIKPKRQ